MEGSSSVFDPFTHHGGAVYCIIFLNLSVWLTLILQITVGTIIYVGLAKLFKLESFTYITDTVKEYLPKKNKGN